MVRVQLVANWRKWVIKVGVVAGGGAAACLGAMAPRRALQGKAVALPRAAAPLQFLAKFNDF